MNSNSGMDTSETGEHYYNIDCLIAHFVIKDSTPITYMACRECRKKVFRDNSTGDWRCDRCNKTYEEADPTYMLLVKLTDGTDFIYVNFYAD